MIHGTAYIDADFSRATDFEPADGLPGDRGRECGAGQGERAADRQRLVGLPLRVPFLDVEIEAGQPMVLRHRDFYRRL
jgi:hypothetical protein